MSYLLQLIAQGEHEHQDFKYQISDARKIARSIAAFANHSGGHLLIGVKDNGHIVGVSSDEEIYMVEQAASMYCRPEQKVEFKIFRHEGKNVVMAQVPEATVKPVKAPDEHGAWKVYYRVADENILASALHVRVMQQDRETASNPVICLTEQERLLLSYLQTHGGITLSGYSRLAHISRFTAQSIVLNLCSMHILALTYHNGHCLITLPDG